jgi:hypothetical protein
MKVGLDSGLRRNDKVEGPGMTLFFCHFEGTQ